MKPSFIWTCRLHRAEKVTALLSVALGAWGRILIANSKWGTAKVSLANDAGFFPKIVFAGFILIGLLLFFESMTTDKEKTISLNLMAFVLIGTWIVYVMLYKTLGFVISSILVTAASLIIWKVTNKRTILLVSVLTPLVLYLGLGVLMSVRFPTLFL